MRAVLQSRCRSSRCRDTGVRFTSAFRFPAVPSSPSGDEDGPPEAGECPAEDAPSVRTSAAEAPWAETAPPAAAVATKSYSCALLTSAGSCWNGFVGALPAPRGSRAGEQVDELPRGVHNPRLQFSMRRSRCDNSQRNEALHGRGSTSPFSAEEINFRTRRTSTRCFSCRW